MVAKWVTLMDQTNGRAWVMANPEHLEILKQGIETWNAWRMKDADLPDLSNANLSELLFGARLTDASFNGANLSGANLSGLNLYRATFLLADLDGSELSRPKCPSGKITNR
jgi:uncharacterized protein YjbI with pentapeptide repeats